MNKAIILLVEDDENLGYILSEYLELNHFEVIWARNGVDGLAKIKTHPVDMCILDIMMPEMDGFNLSAEIKKLSPDTPFIFLTAKSLKVDKLKGFRMGADDYILKPVDEEELLARIEVVLRRIKKPDLTNNQATSLLKFGNFIFDTKDKQLRIEHDTIYLTGKEATLLEMLARNKNQLLPRRDALKTIWGKNDYFNRKSMDVHIHHLRKILKQDSSVEINNVHGRGFILKETHQ